MYIINNAVSIIPSFLSNLLSVFANIKHNTVTNSINNTSNIKLGLKDIGLIVLLEPNTKSRLKIFEPTTLPMINSFSSFLKAVSDVTSSGKDVPIATIVNPTNVSLIPKVIAIYEA